MATGVQTNGDVVFLDSGSYPATDFRKLIANQQVGPGIADYNSFKASLSAGMTLNIGAGAAYVRQPGDGTMYRASQDGSALQITLDTNVSSNPRVDQVILHLYDGSAQGDSSNQFFAQVEVLNGVPTAGATLDNRLGAVNPQSALITGRAYIPLADVLIAGSASVIVSGNIRNRRPVATPGLVPALNASNATLGDAFIVTPEFTLPSFRSIVAGDNFASMQSAALFFNNTPLAVTKLRWKYLQGGIAGDAISAIPSGSNWRFCICDASGTLLLDTGSTAFTGTGGSAINTNTTLSVPYTGYVLDVGAYYAWFGFGAVGNGLGCYYTGIQGGGINGGAVSPGWFPSAANQFLYSNTGGVTFPAAGNILGMSDLSTSAGSASYHVPVPLFSLSNNLDGCHTNYTRASAS